MTNLTVICELVSEFPQQPYGNGISVEQVPCSVCQRLVWLDVLSYGKCNVKCPDCSFPSSRR